MQQIKLDISRVYDFISAEEIQNWEAKLRMLRKSFTTERVREMNSWVGFTFLQPLQINAWLTLKRPLQA